MDVIIPIIIEPSWCERNQCRCPCHSVRRWWDNPLFISAVILVSLWFFMTLMEWALALDPEGTLVELVSAQWEWLKKLSGRVY